MATVVTLTPRRNASTSLTEGTLEEILAMPVVDGEKDGPAFIPARFKAPQRKNANVSEITALVLDFDKLTVATTTAIVQQLEATPFEFYVYETFSHVYADGKCAFRVVLPFAEPFPVRAQSAWATARAAILTHLGFAKESDPACADACRLYYLPRNPPGQPKRDCEHRPGQLLDWRGIVPERLLAAQGAPETPSDAPGASQRDENATIDLVPIIAGLKRPGDHLGVLCGRLLRGEALTPPPGQRPPGEPSRYLAWRDVTNHLANVVEECQPAASSAALVDRFFTDSWAAEVAASPDDHTAMGTVVSLFEGSRQSAPRVLAEKRVRLEAAKRALFDAGNRARGILSPEGAAALDADEAEPEAAPSAPSAPSADDWYAKIKIVNRKEGPAVKKCTENVAYILTNAPEWRGALRFNVLSQTIEIVDGPFAAGVVPLTDELVTKTANWLSDTYDLAYTEQTIYAQLRMVARDNEYDPVGEYLNGLTWDGVSRIDSMLPTYFGTEDTPWSAVVSRKMHIAAVARALQPGCQSDCSVVFEGPQGVRKTTGVEAWAGGPDRFCTLKYDTKDEQSIYVIHSKWIVELGELSTLKNSALHHLKGWLTERHDNYRPKYGRVSIDKPRRCSFVGTTNESDYLNDPTGSRRFWPVKCIGVVDIEAIRRDRDQLWAEAVVAYRAGEQWWLTPEQEALAKVETDQRAPTDVVAEQIEFWASKEKPERRQAGYTMREILINGLSQGTEALGRNVGLETRVGIALRRLKWTKSGRPAKHYPPAPTLVAVPSLREAEVPGVEQTPHVGQPLDYSRPFSVSAMLKRDR